MNCSTITAINLPNGLQSTIVRNVSISLSGISSIKFDKAVVKIYMPFLTGLHVLTEFALVLNFCDETTSYLRNGWTPSCTQQGGHTFTYGVGSKTLK